MTAAVTIAITVYAATTKNDFTIFGPTLYVVLYVFIIASLFAFFFGPTGKLILSCLGVILFSFYLTYDTQMIMGGKNRRNTLTIDDYILASIELYLDIINIFLYLLKLTGDRE